MAMKFSFACESEDHAECSALVITATGEQFRCSCRCHDETPDLLVRSDAPLTQVWLKR